MIWFLLGQIDDRVIGLYPFILLHDQNDYLELSIYLYFSSHVQISGENSQKKQRLDLMSCYISWSLKKMKESKGLNEEEKGHPITIVDQQTHKAYEFQPFEEFWTEHRTTLISYQTQFVNSFKPEHEPQEHKKSKSKKKNIEYEGGFLFPGKPGDKEENITSLILSSKFAALRELFQEAPGTNQDNVKLRQFVRIMLELKHNVILNEFLEIYETIVKEIKEVKFESLREEVGRFAIIGDIRKKVTGFVQTCPYLFPFFNKYLKDNHLETSKLFQVTAYCFLAEKHNFNINEFYCEAFDFPQPQAKPRKKKKTDDDSDHE